MLAVNFVSDFSFFFFSLANIPKSEEEKRELFFLLFLCVCAFGVF